MKKIGKKRQNSKKLSTSINVNFTLHTTALFDPIEVRGKINFPKRNRKKSLIDQLSTYQSILSEFEEF